MKEIIAGITVLLTVFAFFKVLSLFSVAAPAMNAASHGDIAGVTSGIQGMFDWFFAPIYFAAKLASIGGIFSILALVAIFFFAMSLRR